MAYCTTTDVQARLGALFTFSGSTNPASSEIGDFIDQTSATIDSALTAAAYAIIPATGTNDLLMLLDLTANKVALQTLYIAFGADNVPETSKEILGGFRDWLKALANGDAQLIDQEPLGTGAGVMTLGKISLNSIQTDTTDIT